MEPKHQVTKAPGKRNYPGKCLWKHTWASKAPGFKVTMETGLMAQSQSRSSPSTVCRNDLGCKGSYEPWLCMGLCFLGTVRYRNSTVRYDKDCNFQNVRNHK